MPICIYVYMQWVRCDHRTWWEGEVCLCFGEGCVCMCMCMSMFMSMSLCLCMCIEYACMHVFSMYTCMLVCMCICMQIRAKDTSTHACIYTYIHTSQHTYIQIIHINTHTYVNIYIYIHTHAQTYIQLTKPDFLEAVTEGSEAQVYFCTHVCMYVCMCVYCEGNEDHLHVCPYAIICMYVCMCVCMYVCFLCCQRNDSHVHLCLCVWLYSRLYVCWRIFTYATVKCRCHWSSCVSVYLMYVCVLKINVCVCLNDLEDICECICVCARVRACVYFSSRIKDVRAMYVCMYVYFLSISLCEWYVYIMSHWVHALTCIYACTAFMSFMQGRCCDVVYLYCFV